jgi:hypothetical protein
VSPARRPSPVSAAGLALPSVAALFADNHPINGGDVSRLSIAPLFSIDDLVAVPALTLAAGINHMCDNLYRHVSAKIVIGLFKAELLSFSSDSECGLKAIMPGMLAKYQ